MTFRHANLQWRLLRTPVWRIGGRSLQRRVFWHEIQYVILPQARRDTRLGAVASSLILHLGSWRKGLSGQLHQRHTVRRKLFSGISSCLFHLNVAMQLFQSYLICITVDDQYAFFLRVVALVAFKYRIGNTRSI